MDKLRIRQAIVVEGKYDQNALRQLVDTAIFTTNGFTGMKDPALLPPGGLARSFAGLRRPVPDKAPAVERGWRKMVGGELQEALQQVTAGGDAGVQDHLPAHLRQPAKNLLQVVPAGVAGHLRIVPAGAEQPTAEKGIVDIDGIHR